MSGACALAQEGWWGVECYLLPARPCPTPSTPSSGRLFSPLQVWEGCPRRQDYGVYALSPSPSDRRALRATLSARACAHSPPSSCPAGFSLGSRTGAPSLEAPKC